MSYSSTLLLGHRLAWERAGVLHRDISLGNILITDELEENGHSGFIHDFDHSYMTPRIPSEMDDSVQDVEDDERMKSTVSRFSQPTQPPD